MKNLSVKSMMALFLALGLCSCGSDPHEGEVKWNELRELDELAEFGEAYADKKDFSSLKKLVPKIIKASDDLLISKVPSNAHDKKKLKALFNDLEGLKKTLATSSGKSDEQLAILVESYHPLVLNLMESAGLPHEHGDDDHHDDHVDDHHHDDHEEKKSDNDHH